jgi:hypothetical protein
MSEHFTLGSGHIIATISIPAGGITGAGRPEFPSLNAMLELSLTGPRSPGLAIHLREISCRVSPFDGCWIAESRRTFLDIRVHSGRNVAKQQAFLEIPIDQIRLAKINELRKGGDVKLRLDLELVMDELVLLGGEDTAHKPAVWGFREHSRAIAQLHTVIPRSTWVQQVLPGAGFGKIHIVELAVLPLESCAAYQSSFDALQKAQKLESEGYYQEAVGKCRIALEPFFEMVEKTDDKGEKKKVPVLKSSWQTRLGQATYDWLNASLVALKGPANKAVHLSTTSFDQAETQMFLAVTTAVVAYAIKMQPELSS